MHSRLSTLAVLCVSASLIANASPVATRIPKALHKRTFVRGGSCSDGQWDRFLNEASQGADAAESLLDTLDTDNEYFQYFLPDADDNDDLLSKYKDEYLQPFIGLVDDEDFDLNVECGSAANDACNQPPANAPAGSVAYAVTTADTQTITLCDEFFQLSQTSDEQMSLYCTDEERTLGEFETGAFTLLHEFGHLGYVLQPALVDNLYCDTGFPCQELTESNPDGALANADSWMFVAMGAFYANRCERDIPLERDD